MKLKNLLKVIQETKERVSEEAKEDRELLAALKEDNENFSKEDKREILNLIQNHGWEAESAIRNVLSQKLKEQVKGKTIEELFPEIAKDL